MSVTFRGVGKERPLWEIGEFIRIAVGEPLEKAWAPSALSTLPLFSFIAALGLSTAISLSCFSDALNSLTGELLLQLCGL